MQLRERGRYDYKIVPAEGVTEDLCLLRGQGVEPSLAQTGYADHGTIEPGDYCGLFPLIVVRRADPLQVPVAFARVEVRSYKLGYRDHYRGMLTYLGQRCAALMLDSRSSTQVRLATLWSKNSRVLEQQFEFLRRIVDSLAFEGAVEQVLRDPHRSLHDQHEFIDIGRPFKPTGNLMKELTGGQRRIRLPEHHPLRRYLRDVPSQVGLRRKRDFWDTAENRTVKSMLTDFRDFLALVGAHLSEAESRDDPAAGRLKSEARRLEAQLDNYLSRGFLPEVSPPTSLAIGSPVMQQRAGYREILRFWLQFNAGAALEWDAVTETFHAGARDVATLYEYWLFFQLEALFRQKFACDQPLHSVLLDRRKIPAQLILKRGIGLASPISGTWARSSSRHVQAEFSFNKRYTRSSRRDRSGSWTRAVQPDYSISLWPSEFSKQDAERNELMVHVHFDAKYRVERVRELVGDESDDATLSDDSADARVNRGAAKYTDLLKMHAYRDAVRRTAGAYVIYPGQRGDDAIFRGFHEILPGLGAFAVKPDGEGRAVGLESVSAFLDEIVEHLGNRTTARERLTFHVSETYNTEETAVPYGSMPLPETDLYGPQFRALPPAEEMVLVAWYENEAQLDLAKSPSGLTYVRLGRRRGTFHVHPDLAMVRRVLLRTYRGAVARGLVDLREPGFRVYTRDQLRRELQGRAGTAGVAAWIASAGADDDEYIYALFRTQSTPIWSEQQWDGELVMDLIERFESDIRHRPVENVGRSSPYPRILPLRDVLEARVAPRTVGA